MLSKVAIKGTISDFGERLFVVDKLTALEHAASGMGDGRTYHEAKTPESYRLSLAHVLTCLGVMLSDQLCKTKKYSLYYYYFRLRNTNTHN